MSSVLTTNRLRPVSMLLAACVLLCGLGRAPCQQQSSQAEGRPGKGDQAVGPDRQGTLMALDAEIRDRQDRAERAARRQVADLVRTWLTKLRIHSPPASMEATRRSGNRAKTPWETKADMVSWIGRC